MSEKLMVNEEISLEKFTLINDEGKNLGEYTKANALSESKKRGFDLVLLKNSENPICKMMDYSKYRYEQKQKEKLNQKANHKTGKTKEMRFTSHTGLHDLKIKSRKINEFLEEGMKSKISIRFPSRQKETIKPCIEKMIEAITSEIKIEYVFSSIGSYTDNSYTTEISPK